MSLTSLNEIISVDLQASEGERGWALTWGDINLEKFNSSCGCYLPT